MRAIPTASRRLTSFWRIRVKNLSPSLAALALVGAAVAPTFGASIADDFTLKVKGVIQARATVGAKATDNRGESQDFYSTNGLGAVPNVNNYTGTESEMVRFGLRRVRIAFEAANTTGWFANTTIRAEPVELSGTAANSGVGLALYYAFIGKRFKTEIVEHELKIGLDKPFHNEGSISSSAQLFGLQRSTAALIDFQRSPGIAYRISAPFLRAGVDIQNSTNTTRTATIPTTVGGNTSASPGNYDQKPTPFYSFRIEFAPGADMMPTRKTESWAGAEGTHVLIGFDYQNSGKTYAVANEKRTLSVMGPDLMAHWNGLSFLAEYRISKLDRESTTTPFGSDEAEAIDGSVWGAQIGYAIPMDSGLIIEPALRYSVLNMNKDQEERSQWGLNASRDNALGNPSGYLTQTGLTNAGIAGGSSNFGSGNQFDLGMNLYWNGHANKTQIGFMKWTAEKGDGKASAIYVQQQVTF